MRLAYDLLKRSLDLLASAVGLMVMLPVAILIALGIRFTSPGPVFFTQTRIGRRGQHFRIVKFRTMRMDSEHEGSITTVLDQRVTRFGHVLRRYKLDEYPQLWNVFVGNMSLVGPRPDIPGYADRLKGWDRRLLELRPGITGPASLLFRDEESLLACVSDPKAFNDEVIYPAKVTVNLEYLSRSSFWRDIGYIVATVAPAMTARTGLDSRLGLDYESFRRKMLQRSMPFRTPSGTEGDIQKGKAQ